MSILLITIFQSNGENKRTRKQTFGSGTRKSEKNENENPIATQMGLESSIEMINGSTEN